MRSKLGLSQFKAWGSFIVSHSRVYRQVERALETASGSVPYHWYDVLFVLHRAKDRRMRLSDLAEKIVTSKSALTRSIDKMADAGLIKRVQCNEDKRVQYAMVTAKGHQALKRSWPIYRAAVQEYFGKHLSNQEAKQLEKILGKLFICDDEKRQKDRGGA
jgi:DNA-binding MarR family transcriptional regulator